MTCLEANNIFDESRALFCVTQVLAGIFPARGRWTKFTCYGYLFLELLIYYLLFYDVKDYTTQVYRDLEVVVGGRAMLRKVLFYLNLLYLPLLLIPSLRCSWSLGRVYERIDETDKILEYLNISANSSRRVKKDIVHIGAVLLLVTMANLMEYYSLYDHERTFRYTLMWALDRIPEFTGAALMCTFAVLLLKLRSRFKKVNKALGALSKPSGSVSLDANKAYRLKLLRSSHANLSRIAVLANESYGTHLSLTFLVSFLLVCLHLYIICGNYRSKIDAADVLTSCVWVLFNAGKFAYITRTCCATARQAELTNTFVPDCWTNSDSKFTDEARGFYWHLLSSKLRFTIGQCCRIDYATLRTVIAVWTVYSFFLVQFSSYRSKVSPN